MECWSSLTPCPRAFPAEHALSVIGDHQVLIRGDDPGSDAAVNAADARAASVVSCRVQFQSEPGRVAADTGADGGRVLADAAGEHQRVQSAQGGSQRTQLAADAV